MSSVKMAAVKSKKCFKAVKINFTEFCCVAFYLPKINIDKFNQKSRQDLIDMDAFTEWVSKIGAFFKLATMQHGFNFFV